MHYTILMHNPNNVGTPIIRTIFPLQRVSALYKFYCTSVLDSVAFTYIP